MNSLKRMSVAMAGLVLLASPATASVGGQSQASTTIRLRGFVPVICRVNVPGAQAPDAQGLVSLGSAQEFCNSSRGYRVSISHPQDLAGAAIIVDGVRVPLSPTGDTVVRDSSHADVRSVALAIDPGEAPQRLTYLSFHIDPK